MPLRTLVPGLLLTVLLAVAAPGVQADEDDFLAWQPRIPKDGLDREAPGLLAMPATLGALGTTLVRHAQVEPSHVGFRYAPSPEDHDAPRASVAVTCFRAGGLAHRALEGTLRAPNMSGTPWTRWYERADFPDLVYRLRIEDRAYTVLGVVRHTFFRVDVPVPQDAPAARALRLRETDDAVRALVGAIERAGSATADVPATLGEIRLRRIPRAKSPWGDEPAIELTVLPTPEAAKAPATVGLLFAWRLPGTTPHWDARLTYVTWTPDAPQTHGRGPAFPLYARTPDDAALEVAVYRPHEGDAPFKLEVVRFDVPKGATTATWKRSP